MVRVKYYGELRAMTGKREEDCSAATLTALLDFIGKQYGGPAKKAARSALIVADGEKVLSIKKVRLRDHSEVGFFPLCCGG